MLNQQLNYTDRIFSKKKAKNKIVLNKRSKSTERTIQNISRLNL